MRRLPWSSYCPWYDIRTSVFHSQLQPGADHVLGVTSGTWEPCTAEKDTTQQASQLWSFATRWDVDLALWEQGNSGLGWSRATHIISLLQEVRKSWRKSYKLEKSSLSGSPETSRGVPKMVDWLQSSVSRHLTDLSNWRMISDIRHQCSPVTLKTMSWRKWSQESQGPVQEN